MSDIGNSDLANIVSNELDNSPADKTVDDGVVQTEIMRNSRKHRMAEAEQKQQELLQMNSESVIPSTGDADLANQQQRKRKKRNERKSTLWGNLTERMGETAPLVADSFDGDDESSNNESKIEREAYSHMMEQINQRKQ